MTPKMFRLDELLKDIKKDLLLLTNKKLHIYLPINLKNKLGSLAGAFILNMLVNTAVQTRSRVKYRILQD